MVKKITSSLIFVLLLVSIIFVSRIFLWYRLSYIEPTGFEVIYEQIRPTEINIKNEIDALFNYPDYYLIETDLQEPISGEANLFTKQIKIDNNLSQEDYVFTLTHELVHITYFTVNERFCNFTAWKILYESGNEYFINISIAYYCNDIDGGVPHNYSCAGHIERYLEEENNAS